MKQSKPAAFALAVFVALACLGAPQSAGAQAEDHTVLYYLIEMQRRVSRNCQGRAMPAAPSLLPSEALRGMAMESMSSGRSAETVAAAAGLAGTPLVSLSGVGNTPRQAFESIMAGQCPALMGESYRYIGAAAGGGRWTVILAAAEKGPAPVLNGSANEPASAEQSRSASGAGSGTALETQASSRAGQGAAPGPGGKTADRKASGWIDGGEVRYPADRQAEAAPAPPVPVGEMRLDAAGRPVGPLHPVEASIDEAFPDGGADFAYPDPEDLADQRPASSPSPGPAPGPAGEGSAAQGHQPEAAYGSGPLYGPGFESGFKPPDAPGPFGVAAPPQRQESPRPDVIPLTDSRPETAPEAFVYTAPPQDRGEGGGPGGEGGAGVPYSPHTPDGPYNPSGQDGAGSQSSPPAGAAAAMQRPPAYSGDPPGQRGIGTDPVRPHRAGFAPAEDSMSTDVLLTLINAERALGGTCGGKPMQPAAPLTLSLALSDAATAHAADMAARGYFASKAPGGPELGRRVSDAGYIWTQVAENLAKGHNSPQAVIMSWLSDAGQCGNLLDQGFTEAGIGRDPSGRYWVLTLAAPVLLDEGGPRLEGRRP